MDKIKLALSKLTYLPNIRFRYMLQLPQGPGYSYLRVQRYYCDIYHQFSAYRFTKTVPTQQFAIQRYRQA